MGVIDARMLHAEDGLFGIPARQGLQLDQSGLDARECVGRVSAEWQTLLSVDGPIEGVFGDVNANEVAKVHDAV